MERIKENTWYEREKASVTGLTSLALEFRI